MNTNFDGKLQDADRRVEEAKDSLMSRVEEIGRRFKHAKETFDVEAQIKAHPLPAVGIALAVGVFFALQGGRRSSERRGLGGMVVAGLGALTMRMIKDLALSQLSGAAKTWIDQNAGGDATVSRSAEPFLEH